MIANFDRGNSEISVSKVSSIELFGLISVLRESIANFVNVELFSRKTGQWGRGCKKIIGMGAVSGERQYFTGPAHIPLDKEHYNIRST